MPSTIFNNQLPSVIVFGPASKTQTDEYLNTIRLFIRRKSILRPFVKAIEDLPLIWNDLLPAHERIASLDDGPQYLESFSEWISGDGKLDRGSAVPSGMYALPMLLITHLAQYFQYLEERKISHSEMINSLSRGAGAQGYCGGMFAAVCVATSKNEEEIVVRACIAIKTAFAVGAVGDVECCNPRKLSGIMVVREKRDGQVDELVSMFPGTHVSAVTDARTVSICGPPDVLERLQEFAIKQKIMVQMIPIRGKMHDPENARLALDISKFCDSNEAFKIPSADSFLVPFRSNLTTSMMSEGSLSLEIAKTILAEKCLWYQLLTEVALDLKQTSQTTHSICAFGIGDFVAMEPFRKAGLAMTKLDMYTLLTACAPTPNSEMIPTFEFSPDAIAVVGMACRYPGANNTEELWDIISSGKSMVKSVPKNRVNFEDSHRVRSDTKWAKNHEFYGNFISDHDCFDNAFFRVSSKEAAYMDPQQCLLLETAYQAMESSGYIASTQARDERHKVGVFIGASFIDYLEHSSAQVPSAYAATGNITAFLSGKISHYFGFSGPSEVIDTACSSSLVAISRGVRSLQRNECTTALVGGVNFLSTPTHFLDLGRAGFLSPTGQCKPFDISADGYSRSEGVGLIVLKTLADATANRDNILGLIPGISTNQGSDSKSITIPHAPSQLQLYRDILQESKFDASQIGYVEAHGTGTQVGDPIEIESIRQGFASPHRNLPLHLGSIKANIGHCECSAGVASVIKSILMVNKKVLPPLAGFKRFNPKISPIEPSNIAISTIASPWKAPFRAIVVNGYGAAGSNAALLICQPPPKSAVTPTLIRSFPIILSAASKNSLLEYARALRSYLRTPTGSAHKAGDISYTLSKYRKVHKFAWKSSIDGISDLLTKLQNPMEISEVPDTPRKVVLSFSGQFRQFVGLDKRYYDSCPLLRRYLNRCNEFLTKTRSLSIFPTIFEIESLSDIELLQCALFSLQYASAKAWIDCGLKVEAVVGHSFGELTAMAVSGTLTMESALEIISSRARLIKSKWGSERGSMLAIHTTAPEVNNIISQLPNGDAEIQIACYNSETSQVVVGSAQSISSIENILSSNPRFRNIRFSRVATSHGFHSRFTDGLLDDLSMAAHKHKFTTPYIQLESCTQGSSGHITSERISQHMRQPVFFKQAIQRIEKRLGPCVFLEAGVDSPIVPMIKKAVDSPQSHIFLPIKFGVQDPLEILSNLTTKLWQEGIAVSFSNFETPGYNQIWLPPYQFERTPNYIPYIDPVLAALEIQTPSVREIIKGPEKEVLKLVYPNTKAFKEFTIGTRTTRFQSIVAGHNVIGHPLCPAALYLECALMAVGLKIPNMDKLGYAFRDFRIDAPLGIDHSRNVALILDGQTEQSDWSFALQSSSNGLKSKPTVHAKANFKFFATLDSQEASQFQYHQRFLKERLPNFQARLDTETFRRNRIYKLFSRIVDYNEILQGISCITMAGHEVLADLDLPAASDTNESSSIGICDTVALDNFVQVVGVLINTSDICGESEAYLATGADSTVVAPGYDLQTLRKWRVYACFSLGENLKATGDIFVLTPEGNLAVTILGMHFSKLPVATLRKILSPISTEIKTKSPANKEVKQSLPLGRPSNIVLPEDSSLRTISRKQNISKASLAPARAATASNEDIAIKLKVILSDFSGVPIDQISSLASMADLGIDSLAAIELVEELSTQFQIEIGGTEVTSINLDGLVQLCPVLASSDSSSESYIPDDTFSATSSLETPDSQISDPFFDQRNLCDELLETVSEFAAIDTSSISDEATLEDLGVDSLSLIELKSSMEELFNVTQDIDLSITISGLRKLLPVESRKLSHSCNYPIQKPSTVETPVTVVATVNDGTTNSDIVKLIAEYAAIDKASVVESSTLDDLGVDSLSLIELKSAFEETFGVEPDFDLSSTVKALGLQLGRTSISQTKLLTTNHIPITSSALDTITACSGSSPILDPLEALKRCNTALNAFGADFWANFLPQQNSLVLSYILDAFRELNTDLNNIRPGSTIPRIPYTAKHSHLMERLWGILETADIVKNSGSHYIRSSGQLPTEPSAEQFKDLLRAYPQYETDLNLLAVTGQHLAKCLTGDIDGVQLLFGNPTNKKILYDFYKYSALFKGTTDLLLELVKQVAPKDNGAPIRILEVGGGTGSTTVQICDALKSQNCAVQYTFTDISSTLIMNAKKKLGKEYPWMDFYVLDLEKDAAVNLQGKYDIVIGANVVHATSDVVKSCTRIKSLLKDDGFVVLLELTPHTTWFDLVFGLLSGWWSAKDGRKYALQPPEVWSKYMKDAGFISDGSSTDGMTDQTTQQLIIGSLRPRQTSSTVVHGKNWVLETVPYKVVGDLKIEADIYYPPNFVSTNKPMAIALMIHGGGFICLSRRAVRPYQTAYLLSQNILPVSIDYRLCPEIDIISGPITDVRDALIWCRETLPQITRQRGIIVDPDNLVVIGWSTGGHLALTTGWTCVPPPKAILSFYAPADFQADHWMRTDLGATVPQGSMSIDKIREASFDKVISNYEGPQGSASEKNLGFLQAGDPRSELIMTLFSSGDGISLLLNGIDKYATSVSSVTEEQIMTISPLAHVRDGSYRVPTFIIHGEYDEVVPVQLGVDFIGELKEQGVDAVVLVVKGAKHIFDGGLKDGSRGWENWIEPGYRFLMNNL